MASGEGITGVIDASPALIDSPGLAIAAANTPNPQGTAETLAAGSQFYGVSNAMSQFHQQYGLGMASGVVNKLNAPTLLHDPAAALRILNMPLQSVQHTYRYIRDVYHRHGWFHGLMETLGVVAGGTLGALAGTLIGAPELGAIAGAALAGRLEGAPGLGYSDSWKATENPHYMLNGHLVSPGRDLASLLGFHANKSGGFSGWGSVTSGLIDAGIDWTADPLMIAGKLRAIQKSEAGVRGAIAARWGLQDETAITNSGNRVAQFLYRWAPGTGLDAKYPDAPAIAYHQGANAGSPLSGYRRAVDWIAKQTPENVAAANPEQVQNARRVIATQLSNIDDQLSKFGDQPDWQTQLGAMQLQALRERIDSLDPKLLVAVGRIIGQFPEFAPMAEELAKADSPDAVIKVFRSSLFNSEMIARLSRGALPSRTLMRAGLQRIADKVADQDLARAQERGLLLSTNPSSEAGRLGSFGLQPGTFNPASTKYLSRKIRTFTGYAPYTPDRLTLNNRYEFDPKDPNAATGILRSFKFGMGSRTGELWSAIMLHAARTGDEALAKKIWAEGTVENLKAMGLPDDPSLVDYITRKSRFLSQGEFSSQQYGMGYYNGDMVSMVKTASGSQHLGLYDYQTGMLAYPDFMRAKRALRNMSAYTKVFGKLDDFAAEHYTNTFFKPLALMTMGFGLRIALNEALIGTAKYGTPAYITAMVNRRLAKYGYRQGELVDGFRNKELNEQVQIMKAAVNAAGGWRKYAAGAIPDDKLDLALRLIAENDGHLVKGMIAAGHSGYGVPDDPSGRIAQELNYAMQLDRGVHSFVHRNRMVPTGNFEILPWDHNGFEDSYLSALVHRSNEKSARLIASDLDRAYQQADTLDLSSVGLQGSELTPEQRTRAAFDYAVARERKRIEGIDPETDQPFVDGTDPYSRERKALSRYIAQTPHEFADNRVDDLLNLVVGRDGTVHTALIKKLAAGKSIGRSDVANIPVESLPRKVAGETFQVASMQQQWQALTSGAFKLLVDPVVNGLSREPLFLNAVEKHYKSLQGAVDYGLIDDRDALRFAQYRAMNEMLPMIHNTALRTQFGLMVRNFMPFYFAQEQAMKRAAKAISDSPDVARRWMLIEHAMSDPGFVHKDTSTGQSFLVFPGVGALGQYGIGGLSHLGIPLISGLPLTATGDVQSMQTVLPELRVPSMSPVVSLPLNWLANFDPLIAPLTKRALGDRGFKQNLLTTVIPNTAVRDVILAATGDDNFSSFSNANLSAIASAYYHGKLPTAAEYANNPFLAQQKIDAVRNNARSLFIFKALLSIFSPLSPRVQGDLGVQNEWYDLLKKNGNVPGAALEQFLAQHGDKAIAFTVTHSDNKAGGYLPYVQSVQQYLQDYRGTIEQHPLAMAYLAPQSGKTGDVQVIHDELMRLAIKQERTPRQFLEAIYQAQGERIWRASEQAYYNAKGPYPNPSLSQAWQDYEQQFRLWNPVAFDYIKDPARPTRAMGIYRDLQAVYASGQAPATPQAVAVGELMAQFDAHWQQMAALVNARARTAYTELEDQYHQQLVATADQNPDLSSVIYNVFMHLDGVLTGNA